DLGTGKEQSIRITAPKKLSKEEIDKMVKNAEQFAAEDAKRKEEVEIINQADTLTYSTEKSLKDYGDKVSPEERADIEAKLNDLKSAVKDKNISRIKTSMEDLTKASHKLAEEIYKQASAKQKEQGGPEQASGAGSSQKQAEDGPAGAEGGPASGGKKKDDDIIDAEYKEE
ncbi:MAG: Hsp70 family protein, partial [Candidatus Omnitrophica bacterium]|nr:Hsp70 family protein [Candidatus Omnitrophota bacterium]